MDDSTPELRQLEPLLLSTARASVFFTSTAIDASTAFDAANDPGWFHWNGSEVVICSLDQPAWAGIVDNAVRLEFTPLEGLGELETSGRATSDHVRGVAPEYRAAAVRYLGQLEGHEHCDLLPASVITHRLFVTPGTARTGPRR